MDGREKVIYLEFTDDVAVLSDLWVVMVAVVMKMDQVKQRFGIN